VSSKNLLSLLNNLLDLSKLKTGKMEYKMLLTEIKQLINTISLEFESLIKEKDINFEITQNLMPSEIVCDEQKIGQIIRNFISNAIKSTPSDKKTTVSIESGKLPEGRRQTDANTIPALCVKVSDQGVEIPENELDSVFKMYSYKQ